MAWLTTHSGATQLVIESVTESLERGTFLSGLVFVEWVRDVTVTRKRYKGMTYDAAVTAQAALHDPTGTPQSYAAIERSNEAGAYAVVVTQTSYGAWGAPE
jgi:hypothetical protein